MNNIANAVLAQMNEFHTYSKPYDDSLDAWLHKSYADAINRGKNVNWNIAYFSPSSANMCPRALYHKLKKHKKDVEVVKQHQRRWTSLGEKVGDMIQEEFLLSDKHFEKFTGNKPRFTMLKFDGPSGKWPAFEQFIFTQKIVEHNGEKFSILGTSDGILYDRETGQNIGLEVKSKQETPSKTSLKNMTGPTESHARQCVCYAIMYNLDNYVITYVNTAKNKWNAKDEDLFMTPDLRMFDVDVSESAKKEVLDYFAEITKMTRENTPPLPDLTKWMFNPYKNAIAASITDDEMKRLFDDLQHGNPLEPVWQTRQKRNAYNELKELRQKYGRDE